jgi:hypothetical protein
VNEPPDGLRDYQAWHRAYDNPESGLSWRLTMVQSYLRGALNHHAGDVRVLSVCSGDGRDLIEVLAGRPDSSRVTATLVELHPQIAQAARDAAAAAGLSGIEVRTADAGTTDSLVGAVPADVVLLVGIFGNISDDDVQRTVTAAPQLCAAGATLLWSRGRDDGDRNDSVRRWFAEAGFDELAYSTHDVGGRPALGAMRYTGPTQALQEGLRLFTFLR